MDRTVSLSTDASAESSGCGFQQGQIQPGFQNQGLVNQPMNLGQQIGGQMINLIFHADHAPQTRAREPGHLMRLPRSHLTRQSREA